MAMRSVLLTGVEREPDDCAHKGKYFKHLNQSHEPVEVATDDPAALGADR